MKVLWTRAYDKQASKLLTESEKRAAEDDIIDEPTRWPVIPGTRGLRKARVAYGGKGKRGGARIVFYFWQTEDTLYFLAIYAKSQQVDLTPADRKALAQFMESLK